MKIRFLAPSPKAGQIEHCENAAGRALILAGLAEAVPYRDFRERLAATAATASGHGSIDATVVGVEWGIRESDGSPYSVNSIIKKSGSNTTWYSAPPDDAPESIKRRWKELVDVAPRDPFEKERAISAQQEQQERDRIAKLPWEK
jgi:hypothetical protein